MKDFFKSILCIVAFISAFFVGIHFGRTKEKAKIPNFQEDAEAHL